MNLDLLLSFVQAPQKMVDHAVSDLEDMVAEYPYFSAAQLLLLKQYKLQNSSKFNKQLRHAAGVLPDRKQLYRLIEIWPEEVEQAIEAESSVMVVPAQDAAPAVELDALAAPAEVTEFAAPLSEVPLQQLEEVQGLGAEAAQTVVDVEVVVAADEPVAELANSTKAAALEVVPEAVDKGTAEEVISEDPIVEEEVAEVVTIEEMIAEVAITEEPIADAPLVQVNQPLTVVTTPEVEDQVAISQESEVLAAEVTAVVEEWPVPPVVAPEVIEAIEVQAIEAAALKAEEIVAEQEAPMANEPVEAPPVITEVPLKVAAEVESAAAPIPEPVVVRIVTPPAASAISSNTTATVIPPIAPQEVAAFIAQPHARLSWFKFFAGKPLREQSDEVLDQLYQEHMQQDLLRAPEQDQQISAIRAQINREEEVPSSKALEEEIRRLAYESISDDELPASETLAGIYAAQHDYKKAIRIYQKLILKFPDKMSYFARLIEELRAKS